MERVPINREKSTFKCEQCGVYNKVGASACWKCGKVYRVETASDALLALHLRQLNEERAAPAKRWPQYLAALLLFAVPPAGIAVMWLPAIKWRASAKAVLSVLSAAWCALFIWNALAEKPILNIAALLSPRPPIATTAPKLTGFAALLATKAPQGRTISSQPLNINDAVRIYLNDALGGRTEGGLNRVVGVNDMRMTINADGDVNNPDYQSLREQALTAVAAVAQVYQKYDATGDCQIIMYLVGENANNVTYERRALYIVIDEGTMRDTDWSAETPDTLEALSIEYEEGDPPPP